MKRLSGFTIAAAALLLTGLSATSASAQGTSSTHSGRGTLDNPVETQIDEETRIETNDLVARYVDRPLVDPAMTLRVFSGPNDPRTWTLSPYRGIQDYGIGFERAAYDLDIGVPGFDDTVSNVTPTFRIGAAFVPIERLEVGIGFPFAGDGVGIEDIPLWVTYQLVKNETVEIGARFTMFLPAYTKFGLQLGLPVVLHLGDNFRVDTGAFINMIFIGDDRFGDNSPVLGRFFLPARFTVQITDEIFAGGMLGLDVRDFDSFAMMFGFHGGYTLALDAAIIDFGLSFTWPGLVHAQPDGGSRYPGILSDPDNIADGNDFDMQFGANVAIQF